MLFVLSNYNLKEKGKKFPSGDTKTILALDLVEEQLPSNSNVQTSFGLPIWRVSKSRISYCEVEDPLDSATILSQSLETSLSEITSSILGTTSN